MMRISNTDDAKGPWANGGAWPLSATLGPFRGAKEHDENAACSYNVPPVREHDWICTLLSVDQRQHASPFLDGAVGCDVLIKHPRRSASSANKTLERLRTPPRKWSCPISRFTFGMTKH